MSRAGWLAALVLLVGLAIGPSWPWLANPFVRDDEAIVVTNPAVQEARPWTEYFTNTETYSRIRFFNLVCYRPLVPLSLAWDATRGGISPAIFRTTNLLLHALAAVLVLLFVRRLLGELHPEESAARRDRIAVGVALLFAVHPVSAFSALYISNRGSLWMVVGYYATLICYLRTWSSPRPWLPAAGGAACFVLSLCSKEPAVTLVGTALLLEWMRDPDRAGGPAGWARVGGLLIMVGLYFGVRRAVGLGMVQSNNRPDLAGSLSYFLGQCRAQLADYLPAFVWPRPIRWEPLGPPATFGDHWAWLSLLVCLGLVGLAIRHRRTHPVLALGVLAYPITMIPTMVLAQPIPVNFYRPYPGSPFLFLALLWALRSVTRRRPRACLGVAVLSLGALAVGSYRVGELQREPGVMWLHSVRFGGAPRAHYLLANSVADRLARVDALAKVIREFPGTYRPRVSLGIDLTILGRPEEAVEQLEVAARMAPERPAHHLFLAVSARAAGREDLVASALEALERLGWRPSWSQVMGFAKEAMEAGRPDLALVALDLLGPTPEAPWVLDYTVGVAAHQAGSLERAVAAYRRAEARGGGGLLLWRNLGIALRQLGRCEEALAPLGRALEYFPEDEATQANLTSCRAAAGALEGEGAGSR